MAMLWMGIVAALLPLAALSLYQTSAARALVDQVRGERLVAAASLAALDQHRGMPVPFDLSRMKIFLAARHLSPPAVAGLADAAGIVLTPADRSGLGHIDPGASTGRAVVARGRDGAAWVYAAAPLDGGRLFVFYAEPREAAFSLAAVPFRYGLILTLMVILLTFGALWLWLDRILLRWLRRIGRQVRQMVNGDYGEEDAGFQAAPSEVQRLGRDLQELARAGERRDQELIHAIAARDAMAREVNHRVKNNLQMISSIVSLQASRLSDPEARRLMTQTRLRVGALALVQRLIYEVEESEQGAVNTDRMFSELCAEVQANFPPSKVSVSCLSTLGVISGDQAVSAALIVTEALTNALRHGFPEDQAGAIHVRLEPLEGDGLLTICDDGIGSSDSDDPAGMGLDLIQALTSQLDGQLSFSKTAGGGKTVVVRFPCGAPEASI